MPRRQRQGRGLQAFVWIIGLIVISLVASLAVKSCKSDNEANENKRYEKVTNKPIGTEGIQPKDVTVTGAQVPADIKAVKTKPFSDLKMVNSLSTPMEITPHGKLQAPVTLRFKLNRALEKGEKVRVIMRDTPTGELRFVDATVNGGYATVTTDHFSVWQAISTKWREAGEFFRDDFAEFISGGFFQTVDKPKCDKQGEKNARTENYAITSSNSDTVFWCFEKLGNGKRVLRVTNNEHYALQVNYRNARVFDMGLAQAELPELVRLIKGKNWQILLPGQTMQLYIDPLEFGSKASISTTVSNHARGVYALQAVTTVAMMLRGKFGGKKVQNLISLQKQVEEAMDDALTIKNCYNAAVSYNVSSVLYECVRVDKWLKMNLGPLGALVGDTIGMIQTAGGLAKWLRQEIEILSQGNKSAYYITIKRGEVLRFHNLTIPLQSNWREERLWKHKASLDSTGIRTASTCPVDEYGNAWCQGVHIFGPEGGKVGHPEVSYNPLGAWHPFTGASPCPRYVDRTRSGFLNEKTAYPLIRSGTAKLGTRTVQYREWKIGCTTTGGSDGGSPAKFFVQKVWYDTESNIFIVDEWDTPGLKEALANARWN